MRLLRRVAFFAFAALCCTVRPTSAKNYTVSVSPLRWGFAGCGHITNNFAAAVESLPRSEHLLQAFASRNASRAEEYKARFGAVKAYGSYEELAQDPEVDVVYIGTINPSHFEVANLMMDHGKHVLCEKPLTLKAEEAAKLIQRSEQLKLFFQEAVWSRFFPAYHRLRQELPSLGEIKTVMVNKGQTSGSYSHRFYRKELGGGALKDIGGYAIQFAILVFGNEMPEKISAVALLNNETIDTTTSLLIQWKMVELRNWQSVR
ncbi:trans-1,2-dihydrobenzene-1,2-diol dehydrogenase-like [Paramacrobiotus metropolitanus]|uniref:trans-1,2-dihydrobenzene-1,2-diol dehydrogenase-like n=1 Tax=Paramacrobiotus metropolitanus TaxID=2943436 RepID=UPI002445691D|nr:trans-1,2-dihydrobenzene-1,2-diol dehydrogenase-like [Paramacrobiotus metropolitanus]